MNEEMIFEKEMDCPIDWAGDTILMRDGRDNVFEIKIPDDIEEG